MRAEPRKLNEADLQWMNIPPEFWRVRLEQVQASVGPVISRYLKFLPRMVERPAGLMLTGDPGVGKTAIAVLILKTARALGYSCQFLSVWELREMIRNRVMFEDDKTMMDRCREVDLLVLDQLRPEDSKDHHLDLRVIQELVIYRGSHKKPTYITTSMSPDEMGNLMMEFMRVTQGYMVQLNVEGDDLREQLAADLAKGVLGKRS